MTEIPSPARRPLRFSSFELDLHSGELRKAGVLVGLQEQSLKVLAELLERPGDLVTREQLHQRLWPNGTFVDFEHGLNAVINRLRETLGDSAESPRFIQPSRGAATASLRLWTVRLWMRGLRIPRQSLFSRQRCLDAGHMLGLQVGRQSP